MSERKHQLEAEVITLKERIARLEAENMLLSYRAANPDLAAWLQDGTIHAVQARIEMRADGEP